MRALLPFVGVHSFHFSFFLMSLFSLRVFAFMFFSVVLFVGFHVSFIGLGCVFPQFSAIYASSMCEYCSVAVFFLSILWQ